MRDWLTLSREAEDAVDLRTRHTRMVDVVRAVADCSGFTAALLIGPRRHRPLAHARQLAMLVMRECCPFNSYPQMGRLLGGRDHTTIMYGCRVAARRVKENPECAELYKTVVARLECAIVSTPGERPFPLRYTRELAVG